MAKLFAIFYLMLNKSTEKRITLILDNVERMLA